MSTPPKVILNTDVESVLETVAPEVEPSFDADQATELDHMPRPSDEDVENISRAVRKWRAIFIPLLGLSDWELQFVYERGLPAASEVDTAARVITSSWMYKRAEIVVYVHKCYDYENADLRYMIVHEMCHLLTQPLADWGPENGTSSDPHFVATVERSTHNIAAAMIRAYDFLEPAAAEEVEEPPSEPDS